MVSSSQDTRIQIAVPFEDDKVQQVTINSDCAEEESMLDTLFDRYFKPAATELNTTIPYIEDEGRSSCLNNQYLEILLDPNFIKEVFFSCCLFYNIYIICYIHIIIYCGDEVNCYFRLSR